MRDTSYQAVMARGPEIIRRATNIDYREFESGGIGFDYEKMMRQAAYGIEEIAAIQRDTGVGGTPLIELKNITELVRQISPPGKGAKIYIKDEAVNPSGSFKARRASVSVYHACKHNYPGVIAATSGNFGAAIASQAAMRNLDSIIIQEVFDSRGIGQPEIMEKGRACEAYGAEVLQLSVGPELFYMFLLVLEETGFFNASLYTPFSIAGIETLGVEVARQTKQLAGRYPDAVVVTHAGGGNVTGTARGLQYAGCHNTKVIGASVDLSGLHMASDKDFNRKSFTTGHTGFGVPFATNPDRVDVPRNAARPLRYLDRYVTVTQGEVFYVTEMLAALEGLERGPAGNTSLTAAIALARQMSREEIIVVQETEYTGAGKHPSPQLTFAKANGITVRRGTPVDNVPGQVIAIPEHPDQITVKDIDLDKMRYSYIRNALKVNKTPSAADIEFLAQETRLLPAVVEELTQRIISKK